MNRITIMGRYVKIARMCISLWVLVIMHQGMAFSQDDYFFTLSNSRSRAIGMGGAVTAVEDDIGAISFNPAAFSLRENRKGFRFSVHLNPVLPAVALARQEEFDLDRKKGVKKTAGALEYLFRSFTLSTGIFDIGLLLNEEIFIPRNGEVFFDGEGFNDNRYHMAVARVRLSSQVSLGLAGSVIRGRQNGSVEEGFGVRYGLLLKPNRFYQIGIMYVDFSNDVPNVQKWFDRLADESLNAGLTFFPFRTISLSLDVRNLTENDKPDSFGLQEVHVGVETTLLAHLPLRGGYYREKLPDGTDSHIYSAGVSLLDLNRFRKNGSRYGHQTPLLTYAIVFESARNKTLRRHFLTINFRI